MKLNLLLALVILLSCLACRNSWHKTDEFVYRDTDSVWFPDAGKLSSEDIFELSGRIFGAVELGQTFQKLGIPFSESLPSASSLAVPAVSDFGKAIKLGMMGADLGYLNSYGKTGDSEEMISNIRKIAQDINVSSSFDFDRIRSLSGNSSDFDSLLLISIDSFTQTDKYLRENGREHLSALMVAGVWLETQYFATQAASVLPDKLLLNRIGEQKIVLNNLLLLLSPYCSMSPECSALCRTLRELRDKYKGVKITYTRNDPISVEKDGRLVISQTETTVVEMSDDQLAGIKEATQRNRERILSGN